MNEFYYITQLNYYLACALWFITGILVTSWFYFYKRWSACDDADVEPESGCCLGTDKKPVERCKKCKKYYLYEES